MTELSSITLGNVTYSLEDTYSRSKLLTKQDNLSSAQLAATNSGITRDKVVKYDDLEAEITEAVRVASEATNAAAVAVDTLRKIEIELQKLPAGSTSMDAIVVSNRARIEEVEKNLQNVSVLGTTLIVS